MSSIFLLLLCIVHSCGAVSTYTEHLERGIKSDWKSTKFNSQDQTVRRRCLLTSPEIVSDHANFATRPFNKYISILVPPPLLPCPPHPPIQHPIIRQQPQTPHRNPKQQPTINPMPRREPSRLLLRLINPNPHNLPRRPERNIQRNRQPHRARREQITAQPTQQRRNTAERTARR